MLFLLLPVLVILLMIYESFERSLFIPEKSNTYGSLTYLNYYDKHYALFANNLSAKCLIVSKGNIGDLNSASHLLDTLDKYFEKVYDIYLYEYPGYGLLNEETPSVQKCCEELSWWINRMDCLYPSVNLYGYSLGGGITTNTLCNSELLSAGLTINNIYLQSTFSSINARITDSSYLIGLLMKYKNIIDNEENLKTITRDYVEANVWIMHSKNDKTISFRHCERLLKSNPKFNFIEIHGNHFTMAFENYNAGRAGDCNIL